MRNRRILSNSCLLLFLIFGVITTAWAETFDDGVVAYRNGNYMRALKIWTPLAEAGDAAAHFNIGIMFAAGQGVEPDQRRAVDHYRKAAEKGYPPAQFNLGAAYVDGKGVKADIAKAIEWWQKAAANDLDRAQYNLGTLYYFGRGVPKDLTKAEDWFEKAAVQGNQEAERVLAALRAQRQEAATAKVTAEPEMPAPQSKTAVHNAEWLRAREPQHFTIQIFGHKNAAGIAKFVETHELSGDLAQFETRRDGNPWFGLVQGTYPDKQAARAAIGNLPARIRASGPLVRSFADVLGDTTSVAADAATVAPAASPDPVDSGVQDAVSTEILAVLTAWSQAWSSKSVDAYLRMYATDFIPSRGLKRPAWEQQRRQRLTAARYIKVAVSDPVIRPLADGTVRATFQQAYESDNYRDSVQKALTFKRVDGAWQITRERVLR